MNGKPDLWAEYARLALILSSDRPPEKVDAIYLHGLSEGMIQSGNLFDLVTNFDASVISFNGSDGEGMGNQNRPGAAWPGKDWYVKNLSSPGKRLVPTGPGLHTRDETDKLVLLAQKEGWKSVAIASVAYHSVRSMSCVVASMEALGYWFRAHFAAPPTTNWGLRMLGSQGLSETDSYDESMKDAEKTIVKYWQNGEGEPDYWKKAWGAPPPVILDFLRRRDWKTI